MKRPLKPSYIKKMDRTTRIYMAALFDADGTTGVYYGRATNKYRTRIEIVTANEDYADWIREKTGLRKTKRHKKIPYQGHYFLLNTEAMLSMKDFFEQILEFTMLKTDQIKVMLKYIDGEISAEDAMNSFKALKKVY